MESVYPTYGRWAIEVKAALGSTVIDTAGKEYLDFVSGIAVCNLGHRHPTVQKAIEEQLNKVWHVSNLFQISSQDEVAKLLTGQNHLDMAFFCNSGAEANEAAIKLARKHTQKTKIITFEQSFHGRTFATMSATGQEKIHAGYGPLLEQFVYVPYNDAKALETAIDDSTAAVMLEVVQGEGGVVPGEEAFLQKVQELCKENGALMMIDEVQTGIGRTGTLFAFEQYNLKPDIVTVAKGLGSGFPVGALLGTKELKEAFGPGSHASTFGGNPLAMAAAKATVEVINDSEFLKDIQEKGNYIKEELNHHVGNLAIVEEIRGKGLMIGIACTEEVMPLIGSLQEKGLLIVVAGPKVLRLLPPLTVTKEEIDQAVKLIKQELEELSLTKTK